jgi:excisionase family DNA binding protein
MLKPDPTSVTKESSAHPMLLPVPQFAAALGVTVACIRRWLLERKIAHVKLGRLVRIPKAELDRIIEVGYVPPRPEATR